MNHRVTMNPIESGEIQKLLEGLIFGALRAAAAR
jgi:hypothetical protein